MDMKDVYGVGNDILDAVNQAVSKGDFTGLNEKIERTMRDVTGAAAGTAADALHDFQGFVQGTPGQGGNAGTGMPGSAGPSGANVSGGPGGSRTYGHAGRATGNVTEEYMKRAAGARHHTQFTSKISPFLQRRISRGSGTGKIVGGIICLVIAGFTFLDGLFASLVGLFTFGGGNILTAAGITSLVFTLGLAVLGGILIKKGNERKKLVRDYYEYGRIAGTAEYLEIGKLARATGQSRETVLANLEKMISEEMLPAAWFDRQKTTLMLSERMYNEYLRLERERQEEEAEKAKQEMEKRAAGAGTYGAGAGGAAGGSSAGTAGIDEDLRPLPEDARLPADARKIVEEGLLYISRIRAFNREIEDEEISAQLAQLEITMKRILDQIRKDPSSAPNLRRLMVYYLPTTMKLLDAYGELDRQPFAGENIASTKKEIRDALGTINHAFENLLDSLFQDMAWDISSDISVMKTMMAQDGLTGDQMRRAAARAAEGQAGQAGDLTQEDAARPAEGVHQTAGGLQTEAFDGYTEGYTEDPAAAEGGLAAQVQAEQEEQAEGIRLKFGE